jgi:PAS domain S-box-containing protein
VAVRLLRYIEPSSIQGKFALWAGLCLVLTTLIITTFAALALHRTSIRAAEEHAVAVAATNARRIDAELERALNVAHTLAQLFATRDDQDTRSTLAHEQVHQILRELVQDNPQFAGVYTLWEPDVFDHSTALPADAPGHNASGRFVPYWSRSPEGEVHLGTATEYVTGEHADHYQCPRRTGQACILEPFVHSVQGEETALVSLVAPIQHEDRFYGVAGVDMRLESLQDMADHVDLYEGTGKLSLISHAGTLAALTGAPELVGQDARAIHADFDTDEERQRIQMGEQIIEFQATENEIEIFVPLRVGDTNTPWAVGVLIPAQAVTSEANLVVGGMVGGSAVLIVLALVLLWSIAGRVARPIKQLTGAAQQVAQGDLTTHVAVQTHDETATLASAFNRMVTSLRQMVETQQQAHEALYESEARFRTVADFTYDWEYWNGPDGTCYYMSPACERVTGYHADEFMADPALIERIVHPDDRADFRAHVHDENQAHNTAEIEFRIITRGGGERWIGHVCQPVPDHNGDGYGRRASNRDITERKQVEHALRDSQALLQGLLDHAPLTVYVKEPAGRFLLVNREFATWLRTPAWQIVGKMQDEFFPPVLAQAFREQDQQVAASGEAMEIEETAPHEDGLPHTYLTTKFPLYNEQGDVYAVGGICSDITERKRLLDMLEQRVGERTAQLEAASRELQHNRDVLQAIFDGIQDGLLLLDQAGTVLVANRAAHRLLGENDPALSMCPCKSFAIEPLLGSNGTPTSPDDCWVLATLRDGLPRRQRGRLLRDDASPRMLDMQALPVSHANDTASQEQMPDQVVLHVADVTEQLQLEALMIDNERSAASQQLTRIIAHEVNSPLQAIMFSLDMLHRRTHDAEQQQFLQVAQEEITRIGKILRQLKDIYQTSDEEPAAVDINALIERVLLLTDGKLSRYRIGIERHLTPELPAVRCRADQLMQVLLNLVLNAIDAMPHGGRLQITSTETTTETGPCVQVMVADTGSGIEPHIQEHIFEPFFTTKEHGSGLGLSVSHKIVHEAGGTLTIASTPGAGTTFTICLPLNKEPHL